MKLGPILEPLAGMKSHLTTIALLSFIAVGCSDRERENRENTAPPAENQPPAATAPAENQPPPAPDTAAPPARVDEPGGARATTGARPAQPTTTQPRSSARSSASRPAEDRATPSAPANTARPSAAAPRAPEFRELTLPAGTALPLELQTALSSETAEVEAPVRARLRQTLTVNGVTALPAGTILTGEVTDVARAGKVKGRSRLVFTFNRFEAENIREDLRTNPLTFEGEASKGEDATKIGAGAVGGAIVGGILGGGSGAAKGAAIGGAAGTGVVLATRGKDVTLASGADLAASLAEPLTIRVPVR
jgi:hypothetical protein